MKSATKLAPSLIFSAVLVFLISWSAADPTSAAAQGQGNNAVYYQSGSSGVCCKGSSAFIDASVFATSADTFCSAIYKILNSATYTAAVIDARGLPGSAGTSMTCAAGWTPWNNGTTFLNKPSTILLPAANAMDEEIRNHFALSHFSP